MATKDAKARDDEDDDRDDEEEDDDDPDAGVPVPAGRTVKAQPAKPVVRSRPSSTAKSAAKPSADKHGHGGHAKDAHGHGGGIDDETQDPSWWTPYAVLGVIVVIGVFGFFGAFSGTPLARLKPPGFVMETHEEAAPAQEPTPEAPPAPNAKGQGPDGAADAETFGARHLLVMYKDSRKAPTTITRSKDEALARAKEAMGKAKAPGAKFEDLVTEYSDEPGAGKRGGNLGNFRRGAMVKEFQDALDKMKVGDISDVVETPFGYHVIQRTK